MILYLLLAWFGTLLHKWKVILINAFQKGTEKGLLKVNNLVSAGLLGDIHCAVSFGKQRRSGVFFVSGCDADAYSKTKFAEFGGFNKLSQGFCDGNCILLSAGRKNYRKFFSAVARQNIVRQQITLK